IDDAKASREHARIWRESGALRVMDLGSRNGTRVNRETLRGSERALRSGDVVRIGAAEILIAESAAAVAGDLLGGRLEAALRRLRASESGKATLLRITSSVDDLARMAPALAGAVLVEAQGDDEYACLFAGDAAGVVGELKRLAPAASFATAQSPRDGDRA